MSGPGGFQILEIGNHHFAKTRMPGATTLVWTWGKPLGDHVEHVTPTLFSLWSILWRLLRRRDDLVIVYVEQWAPWHWKHLRRIVGWRPVRTALRLFFIQFLRVLPRPRRLMVVDLTEWGFIHGYNEFLLDKCDVWFKRELPLDRWRVFRRASGGGYPGARFRRNARNQERLARIRPLSLGCTATAETAAVFPAKTSDVFVAAMVDGSSTLRAEGLEQLRALREQGVAVDIAEDRLAPVAFQARMAQAWLTWSPHGYGWDCFRHYEAPLALSVPVMSTPTIVRQNPLLEGEHGLYYAPDDPTDLARVVRAALADKPKLQRMALAARAHVASHHLWPDRIEGLIGEAMGAEQVPAVLPTPAAEEPARPPGAAVPAPRPALSGGVA